MSDPRESMPQDVLEVHDALLANANENWPDNGADAVYTHLGGDNGAEPDVWFVGCNYEGFGSTMLRMPDKSWKYRSGWDGTDRPAPGGHAEMLANARIFFTG